MSIERAGQLAQALDQSQIAWCPFAGCIGVMRQHWEAMKHEAAADIPSPELCDSYAYWPQFPCDETDADFYARGDYS